MTELIIFLKKFGIKSFDQKVERIDNAFFVVPDQLRDFVKYRPAHVGLKLGFVRGAFFIPSIGLLQWMVSRAKNTIVLNEEQEWKFICANNIRLSELDCAEKTGTHLLVLNRHNEAVGTALISDKYLRRVFDIGDLLRRERKSARND